MERRLLGGSLGGQEPNKFYGRRNREPHGTGLSNIGRILIVMKNMISKASGSKQSTVKTTSVSAKAKTSASSDLNHSAISFSAHFTQKCLSCDGNVKSIKREFSDQAWAALVAWNEIQSKAVDTPLCNDCYHNFRDVLIERADEVRLMSSNVANAAVAKTSLRIARA